MGWKDGCENPDRIPSAGDEESCRLMCCQDVECEAWQFGASGCFVGKVLHCNSKKPRSDLIAGQMITHGDAEVLDPAFKVQCPDNGKILDIASGTTEERMDKCRNKCMANRMCTYWQLKTVVTEVGDVSPEDYTCHYGDYLECDAVIQADPNVKFGERISHVCRSAPSEATIGVAVEDVKQKDFGFTTLFFGVVALLVVSLLGVFAALTLMQQNKSAAARDLSAESGSRELSDDEEEVEDSEAETD